LRILVTNDECKRKYYWITRTRPAWEMEEGTDVWSVRHRRVSITPLQTDMTPAATLPTLAALPQQMLHALSSKSASSARQRGYTKGTVSGQG